VSHTILAFAQPWRDYHVSKPHNDFLDGG